MGQDVPMNVNPFHNTVISFCIELSSREKMFIPLIFIFINPSLMPSLQEIIVELYQSSFKEVKTISCS